MEIIYLNLDVSRACVLKDVFDVLKDFGLLDKTILIASGQFNPGSALFLMKFVKKYCPDFYNRKAFINIPCPWLLANERALYIGWNVIEFQKAGGWSIQFKGLEALRLELEVLYGEKRISATGS